MSLQLRLHQPIEYLNDQGQNEKIDKLSMNWPTLKDKQSLNKLTYPNQVHYIATHLAGLNEEAFEHLSNKDINQMVDMVIAQIKFENSEISKKRSTKDE